MSEPTGVIHDIGYRHYDGVRLGRGHATVALAVHSLRGVFGLGRTARAKIIPFLLVGVMLLPAVVSIAVMAMLKQEAITYTSYAVTMQAVLAIFLASQSPYTVAPDLRFRVLPLYLSRPVTLWDYVGAKLTAMITAMFLLLAVPLTVLYIGELVIDLPGPPHTSDYLTSMAGAVVTSGFGWRWGRMHQGIDISAPCGTQIRAAASGTVIVSGYSGGYGNLTVVDHGNGLATAYAHQSAIYAGGSVSQGQVIGAVGTTGSSTGCHLHFEVRVNGSAVDPMGYL